MNVEHIRRFFQVRPFRSIEIRLDSGNRYRIAHPEVIILHDLVITVDATGTPVWFDPASVSAVHQLRNGRRRR